MCKILTVSVQYHLVCVNLEVLRKLCEKSRCFLGKFTQLAQILHDPRPNSDLGPPVILEEGMTVNRSGFSTLSKLSIRKSSRGTQMITLELRRK